MTSNSSSTTPDFITKYVAFLGNQSIFISDETVNISEIQALYFISVILVCGVRIKYLPD